MNNWSYKRGFTMVELLIVVVVIAMIVALTAVVYTGIQQRARDNAVLSDIDAVESEIARYSVNNSGMYGAELVWYSGLNGGPSSNANIVFTPSPGNVIDVVTSDSQYCIRAYNIGSGKYPRLSVAAYKESVDGACGTLAASATAVAESPEPVGPVLPTITNNVINPSAETNQTGYGGPNGSTVLRVTDRSHSGSASLRATMPIGGTTTVGAYVYNPGVTTVPNLLAADTTYMASVWVYVPAATNVDIRISVQGTGRASIIYPPATYSTSAKDTWVRLSAPFMTNSGGSITMYILNTSPTTTAGMQFWTDSFMITETDTLYNFADGNTTDWTWSGTQDNSTSSGPGITSS